MCDNATTSEMSAEGEVQQRFISLKTTAGTDVLLSLAKNAAVIWQLLSLVADCSRLEMLLLETPGSHPVINTTIYSAAKISQCVKCDFSVMTANSCS